VIGAHVEGFAALVFDKLAARHLPELLKAFSAEQREQVLGAQRDIRQSAEWWLSVTTAEVGSAAVAPVAGGASSSLIDVEEAAVLLGVKVRQARTTAQRFEGAGLAEKVGGVWLLDRSAVEVLAESRRNRRCA
jgi:hypothetical protein